MTKAEKLGVSEEQLKKITAEVMNHSMAPKNYGKLESPNCIGRSINAENGDSLIMYQRIENDVIEEVSFVTEGCKDMVIAGSLFTEMIKGDTLENAQKTKENMLTMILNAPPTQKDVGLLVLKAFEAGIESLGTELSEDIDKINILKINEK